VKIPFAWLKKYWPRTRSARWFAVYLLWCLGLTLGRGSHLGGLPLILAGILLVPWTAPPASPGAPPDEWPYLRALILEGLPWLGLAALIQTPGIRQRTPLVLATLLVTFLTLSTALIVLRFIRRPKLRWTCLLAALYFCSGVLVIKQDPTPRIDAFTFEQLGAQRFLRGRNPYSEIYPNIYTPGESRYLMGREMSVIDYYVYPPLSLFLTTGGYAAGGDIRFAMLAAQAVFGILLWGIASASGLGAWPATAIAAASYLLPLNLFTLDNCWTEPLVACSLALFFWCLVRSRSRGWGWALGLFLSMKQYSVMAVPLLLGHAWAPSRRVRGLLQALALTALIFAPFVLWSPLDLLNDLVVEVWRTPLRPDHMSIPALVFKLTGLKMYGWFSFLAAIAAAALVLRRVPAGPLGLALGLLAVYLAFFLFGKQAAPNYHVFLAQLVLLCVALQSRPAAPPSPETQLPALS
jgi:hypothetical protein